MKALLTAMESAVSDHDLITIFLMDQKWRKFFGRISAKEYGLIDNIFVLQYMYFGFVYCQLVRFVYQLTPQ